MIDIWRENMIGRQMIIVHIMPCSSEIRMKKQIWLPIIFSRRISVIAKPAIFFQSAIYPVRKTKIMHLNSEMESWKVALFYGFLIFKK